MRQSGGTHLAAIPARGGSKGIPRKNLRMLAGKPLIAHTIEHALKARNVSRVVVSTDDAKIAEVAQRSGAEVVRRPPEISGDTASSEDALLHALDYLKEKEGYEPDLVVFLQCTSPLTLPDDIDGTMSLLAEDKADSAMTVTPFHGFLWRRDRDGGAHGINHDKVIRLRRQEHEEQFLETGAVYVMRTEGFRQARHRFFGKIAMYVVPPERSLEIDEPADLVVAEALLLERQRRERIVQVPKPVAALILDFDGVFTDNGVVVLQNGTEAVVCNRSDGLGLAKVKKAGIPVLVLSTEQNAVVSARCRKLGLECLQGLEDKGGALRKWLGERNLDPARAVYVGNDTNDLSCMEAVGCSVAVTDAHPVVLRAAHMVLSRRGGHGAIREVCDLILQ